MGRDSGGERPTARLGSLLVRFGARLEHRRREAEQAVEEAAEATGHAVRTAERAVERAEHRNDPPPLPTTAVLNDAPSSPARPRSPAEAVPWSLRVSAELVWRLIVVGAGLYFLFQVVQTLRIVALAFIAALLISALLQPTVAWL